MSDYAVIGAGYGDEGKGKAVSWLCSFHDKALVVRYCGGHQAGHHVMLKNGFDHVFSNFGSGTAQGVPTYWSRNCTVDPVGLLIEYKILKQKGITPKLYIDRACPITTPHEKVYNVIESSRNKHGSCGVGVGATYEREEKFYSLLAEDLMYPRVLDEKVRLIGGMYGFRARAHPEDLQIFKQSCKDMLNSGDIVLVDGMDSLRKYYTTIIFEGAQGLLLDQHYGFFPHVTRANTGTKNITMRGFFPQILLVSRTYQTRHGNGFLSNEHLPCNHIVDNPFENNTSTGFQGEFRRSILDTDMLQYAINKDPYLRNHKDRINLLLTCTDLSDRHTVTSHGVKIVYETPILMAEKIKHRLGVDRVSLSGSPYPEAWYVTD